MKKLTLLLAVVLLTFNSCDSDDDNPIAPVDLVIGTWMLSGSHLNGNQRLLNECSLRSNFVFKSDGTFTETVYYAENDAPCELDFADPGTWKSLGNNTYNLKYDPDEDGDVYEEDIILNNNTFSIYYDQPYIYEFTKKFENTTF